MFNSAQFKLTLWYIVIVMVVSLTFSFAIYRMLIGEVERFTTNQRVRIERRLKEFSIQPVPYPDDSLVKDVERRLLLSLGIVNGIILFAAGGLGYIFAGRTLRPIKEMVDEQNRFVSDASHELKTPLTSLKTAFEVHLRDKTATKQDANQLITESVIEVDKLQTLSESLLQLAQYQKPVLDQTQEKLALRPLIVEAVKKLKPVAKQKKIRLKLEAIDATIFGNQSSLTNLFLILLDNAIKYSPEKKSVFIAFKKNKKTVSVTFTDLGIGISKQDLPHIFDRFYRSDEARTRNNSGGYGLGLSIAKKIVHNHQGSIAVKSKLKTGTTVDVSLPLIS